jgi:integrase
LQQLLANPCAKFKHLEDERKKAKSRPQPYTQEELNRLLAACDEKKKAIFATLALTGLRKRELYFLAWRDVDLKAATVRVSGDGKEGFSPKDYEERIIPIPPDLVAILEKLPRNGEWVFTNYNGGQITHLLRRLKASGDNFAGDFDPGADADVAWFAHGADGSHLIGARDGSEAARALQLRRIDVELHSAASSACVAAVRSARRWRGTGKRRRIVASKE